MVADSTSVKTLITPIWVLCELKGVRDRLSGPAPATPGDLPGVSDWVIAGWAASAATEPTRHGWRPGVVAYVAADRDGCVGGGLAQLIACPSGLPGRPGEDWALGSAEGPALNVPRTWRTLRNHWRVCACRRRVKNSSAVDSAAMTAPLTRSSPWSAS